MLFSFAILLLVDGLVLIILRNPIHSVLILILVFLKTSILIMILKIEFLALLLLLVYLGAVAVLFIFVVMMLNIKILERQEQILQYMPLTALMALWIFFLLDILINVNFQTDGILMHYVNWSSIVKDISNVKFLANVLYSIWHVVVLVASLILLISMLGSIALELLESKKHVKKEIESDVINYTFRHYKKLFDK